ncbi:glycosyltransferase [Runella sp. CRIBMP]|uniref:glycosyltransferase n=1 Tax=Runella sp. CRIBMP TaxID=2683261 RepID=UPI00141219A8|nr:glycosyltransferase [Runella sp. CRIBMP]NBB22837.1 glycosyltransferase [Runella sp. CRIBMP]
MKRILVNAYACEPFKGSEQGVGWNFVLQLAKDYQVDVITRSNNRSVIEANLPRELKNNLHFHYYDTHPFILKFKRKANGLYLYYFFWQIGVFRLARKLSKGAKFDYSFQPTMGSMWMPTFFPFLNISFIWGPLGGGEGVPKSFLNILPVKDRIIQSFRYSLKYLVYINPLLFYSLYKSKILLIRTENSLDFIPKKFRYKTHLILETAIESDVFKYSKERRENDCIHLIITGRLVPFKNVISVIHSLKLLPNDFNFKLDIIGSGPEKKRIKQAIDTHKLKTSVNFIDELQREEVLRKLCKADIYLFPSLREGGSWALMEAMAVGLPVICLNWTGNAVIIDEKSAIGLEVTNPQQFIIDFADSIMKLANNRQYRIDIGRQARIRIKEKFSWLTKVSEFKKLL